MKISASETQRDSSRLKTSLQHWFRFGDLKPEQGIALLLGLEADDAQLAAIAEWGKDKKRDWGILNSGILMLNGDVLKLPTNPKLIHNETLSGESRIAGAGAHDFSAIEIGYESTEAELELFEASLEAEVISFAKFQNQVEQDWRELMPGYIDGLEHQLGEIVGEYKKWLGYWQSDQSIHPTAVGLSYFVTWAKTKRFIPKWQSVATKLERSDATDEAPNIPEFERERLLKQVAALALVLAEKSDRYKRGDKPNASQIATAVEVVLDEVPGANLKGLGKSNIRESIKEGLKLIA